jgi:hypothetical protein
MRPASTWTLDQLRHRRYCSLRSQLLKLFPESLNPRPVGFIGKRDDHGLALVLRTDIRGPHDRPACFYFEAPFHSSRMRFEERVKALCGEALTASEESEVCRILAELRSVLHQHVEQLRKGLFVAYSKPIIRRRSVAARPTENRRGRSVRENGASRAEGARSTVR